MLFVTIRVVELSRAVLNQHLTSSASCGLHRAAVLGSSVYGAVVCSLNAVLLASSDDHRAPVPAAQGRFRWGGTPALLAGLPTRLTLILDLHPSAEPVWRLRSGAAMGEASPSAVAVRHRRGGAGTVLSFDMGFSYGPGG